ncbi:hypothetical protein MPCS_01113 [Candidatus Megaera polyxenophila]|nr:hypothetical protein MPCS_01113 [Candidatus Megaera polyxenophila]
MAICQQSEVIMQQLYVFVIGGSSDCEIKEDFSTRDT